MLPEPIAVLAALGEALEEHGEVVLCTIVRAEGSTPGKVGWRLMVCPDGSVRGNLGGGAFEGRVVEDARMRLAGEGERPSLQRYRMTESASDGQATGMVCGGMAEVFFETLATAPLLVICGGGPIGQALAAAAVLAGFRTLVADDRREFLRRELFPASTGVVPLAELHSGGALASMIDRELFVAVVTRGWETDVAAIESILRGAPSRLRYLGLMGSRRKIERVRGALRDGGVDLEGIGLRAPIGLPIGGDTPGEIAISIMAEILEARYGR